MQTLVASGVDVNAAQPDGATALHWAAHWDDGGMAGLLLRAGARVNAANDFGVTPLLLASGNGRPAMIALLLEAGADPNLAAASGERPLMAAARAGSLEAVDALLDRGAEVNYTAPGHGQSALMWAISEKHSKCRQAARRAWRGHSRAFDRRVFAAPLRRPRRRSRVGEDAGRRWRGRQRQDAGRDERARRRRRAGTHGPRHPPARTRSRPQRQRTGIHRAALGQRQLGNRADRTEWHRRTGRRGVELACRRPARQDRVDPGPAGPRRRAERETRQDTAARRLHAALGRASRRRREPVPRRDAIPPGGDGRRRRRDASARGDTAPIRGWPRTTGRRR